MTSSNGNILSVTDCTANSPVTGEFPSQRPVTRSFDVFFDLHLKKCGVNNRDAGNLRRNGAHYDVILMIKNSSNHAAANGCASQAGSQSVFCSYLGPAPRPFPLNINMLLKKLVSGNFVQKLLSGSCSKFRYALNLLLYQYDSWDVLSRNKTLKWKQRVHCNNL